MTSKSPTGRHRVSPLLTLLTPLLASVVWVAFTGSTTPPELAVGCIAVALTTVFTVWLQRHFPIRVKIYLRDVLHGWQILPIIVKDSWTVLSVLFRNLFTGTPVPSSFCAVPWIRTDDTPEDLGRGVVATAYLTSTPNALVLGIDREQSLLICHQIRVEPPSRLARQLGAS